jgi:hypothetical protein
MMFLARLIKVGPRCVVSDATLSFLESKRSEQERHKSRKMAFHVHPTCSVTEESDLRNHQALPQTNRTRAAHR